MVLLLSMLVIYWAILNSFLSLLLVKYFIIQMNVRMNEHTIIDANTFLDPIRLEPTSVVRDNVATFHKKNTIVEKMICSKKHY